jgi:two-component system cell cycle sensor histidine kinase/response regulator CckA
VLSIVSNLLINLRLRTKLLLSLVLTTAILTCAMLLAVRYSVQKHAQQQVVAEARSSLLTFDALLGEHQKALARKADLLATRASMAGDDVDVTPSSDDALESDGSDLIAIADASNNIVVLHSRNASAPLANAREMLTGERAKGFTSDWWYVGGALYQVSLQRIGHGARTMIVGREIDYRAVRDMGRVSSSQVIFSYEQTVVASTFRAFDEQEAGKKIQDLSSRGKIKLGDDQFFADTLELNSDPGHIVRVTALKSYSEATAFLTTLNHLLVSLGFLAVLAGAALVFFISDTFTRPLANLLNGFEALESGNYAFPLHAAGGDEVACATRAFDRTRQALQKNEAQKRELEDQLRQSQKMEALGRLAGGVAHDFNNLLTVIKGHSELILDGNTRGAAVLASGQQIRKAADRAAALTRQMLAFSRKQALQPKILDVNAIVEDVGKFLKRLIPEDVEVIFQTDDMLGRVKADASQLEQVLLNLTVNARDAMPQGGKLTIETRNVTVDAELALARPPVQPGDYVRLAVIDTGTGMDAETKAHIFEPFFTTKEPGKGTGLGLATVYGVVKQTGGFIWVDTALGFGSKFEIYLPRVHGNAEADVAARSSSVEKIALQTVLLAEDEAEVRALAYEFLTSAGYRVLVAEDGVRAMQIAEYDNTIDILVTDVVMPRMRGPELAKRMKRLKPGLKVVYVSGYLEPSEIDGDFLKEGFLLEKPFSRDTLVNQIGEALSRQTPLEVSA